MNISLIICPFNQKPEWLSQCLNSIPPDVFSEVIVVDGGSIHPVAGATIRTGVHCSISTARNLGAAMAKGDWLCYLDSDDELIESGCRQILELEKLPGIGIDDCDVLTVNGQLHGYQTGIWPSGLRLNELHLDNTVSVNSLFRREWWFKAGGFVDVPAEDWIFWYKLFSMGAKFYETGITLAKLRKWRTPQQELDNYHLSYFQAIKAIREIGPNPVTGVGAEKSLVESP